MAIHNINAATLKDWLDKGQAVVVDVREPAEHASEKIEGATLLPLGALSKATLPLTTGKKLVLHCKSGKRGTSACEKLLAEDPHLEIYHLEGGISAWAGAGQPVALSDSNILPLDQQVQLTIGLGVLLGSLLGYFVSPTYFLLSGFFGAGLTFAGLTGFCGLARVMAKMPWNQVGAKNATSCCSK